MRTVAPRTAVAVAVCVALIPAAVLALTFYGPFVQRLPASSLSLPLVRGGSVVALAAVALLFALRGRIGTLLQRLDAHVHAEAARAAVPAPGETPRPVALALVLIAVAMGVVAVSLAVASPTAYRAFIREDGIVEYGSALAWLSAALCGVAALPLDRRRFGMKILCYALFVGFLVFAGGEEISWGQRILGYQTPEALAAVNKQREVNVHDIGSITLFANAFFLVTTVCCLVIPWLLQRAPAWRRYLRELNLPIVDPMVARVYTIGLAAWVIVGVRFGTLGFWPLSLWHQYTQMDDEIWEFYAALGFCALAAFDLAHRVRESRRTPAARGAVRSPQPPA